MMACAAATAETHTLVNAHRDGPGRTARRRWDTANGIEARAPTAVPAKAEVRAILRARAVMPGGKETHVEIRFLSATGMRILARMAADARALLDWNILAKSAKQDGPVPAVMNR
eukprot:COSAG04_NODE_4389_length_2124_cov_5.966914_2_plen_114_part_00